MNKTVTSIKTFIIVMALMVLFVFSGLGYCTYTVFSDPQGAGEAIGNFASEFQKGVNEGINND